MGKQAMFDALTSYLNSLFRENVAFRELSDGERRKAGWMVNFYTPFRSSICGKEVLFAIAKGANRLTPSAVAKQVARIRDAMGLSVVYVPAEVAAHDVPRLIALHVPFVVPGKAVFLPDMGIMLEKRLECHEVVRDKFSVAAQLIAIGVMLGKLDRKLTICDSASATGFSAASVVHAFQELVHFGLCERGGRSGCCVVYALREPLELWELGRNRFFNPCKREIGVDVLPDEAVEAGDMALSAMSEINPPEIPTYAVPIKGFRSLGLAERGKESAKFKLQLWLYPPTIFGNGVIDRFSLALSLRDNPDDRIQIATENIMGDFKW